MNDEQRQQAINNWINETTDMHALFALEPVEVANAIEARGYTSGEVKTVIFEWMMAHMSHAMDITPPWEEPTTEAAQLSVISANELMTKEFPQLIQAVDRFICEGLTFLVAASKIGKSWLVLLMALCVARGTMFLGRATTKCRVIYFALEDSQRRLQGRLQTMGIDDVPDNLFFVTKAEMLDTGFMFQLEAWLTKDTTIPALVIIDTFQKIRGVGKGGQNAYQQDYDVVSKLKGLADRHRAMIVCVHHTNKNKLASDPYDRVSGSTGIMGAADTTILMDRERGTDTATVRFEGRDVYGKDFVIKFQNGMWTLESEDAEAYTAGQRYEEEPLVQLFRLMITENPKGGRWTYSDLQQKGYDLLGFHPFSGGRDCSSKLTSGLKDEIRKRDKLIIESGIDAPGGKGVKIQPIGILVAFQTKAPTETTETT